MVSEVRSRNHIYAIFEINTTSYLNAVRLICKDRKSPKLALTGTRNEM